MINKLISTRTIYLSFLYLSLSLLLVFFANEGGENTPYANFIFRGRIISLLYYLSQIGLMLAYLHIQRIDWRTSILIIIVVAFIRLVSSGIATLTIAMVMGKEITNNRQQI